jgi:hypothetical protein
MSDTIPLIDSPDGFELVRDAVANILATESALQVAEATNQGKPDPSLWELDVYVERSNPWEAFRDDTAAQNAPILNVWYESSNTNLGASDLVTRQQGPTLINIDCLGYGRTTETAEGHDSGDKVAALEVQRAVRLARKILMDQKYVQLGLKTVVARRFVSDRQSFQPISGNQPIQNVAGIRLTFTVDHAETVDMATLNPYEGALVTIKYDPDESAKVIAQLDIDHTA